MRGSDGFKAALREGSAPPPKLQQTLCHFLIKETAEGMAKACYEKLASMSDVWYATHPSVDAYVRATWPMLIDEARATLTRMLTLPLAEELKIQISDALIADKTLPRRTKRRTILWHV